jgi:iron complex outermembrane recepter protein
MIGRQFRAFVPVCATCAFAAATGLVPSSVRAQALELEEVTVTAERRETALQDTPISIVALSSEALERKGVEELSDIALFTPNLAINGSRGYGNNQPTFSIRGISGGGGTTSERGVALYIDGIYVPRTNGSIFKVFDIERIEVLRGPQGTLFGRNSTGGAVRLVTSQPAPEFESYLRGTLGNFDRREISGMVNVPVSDKLSIRAQGAYLEQDGYVTRGTQKLGSTEDILGRLQAAYEFTDDVKLTLGALYSDSKSDGSPQDLETFDQAPFIVQGNYADWLSDALVLANQAPLATVDDERLVLNDFTMPDICLLDDFNPDWDRACEQKNDNEYYQLDAKLEWSLNDNMSLTSTSGYAQLDHQGVSDWQLLGMERRPDDVKSKVLYQELQLNAALFNDKIDLVTGVNYFQEKSSSSGFLLNRRGTSTFNPQAERGNADGGLIVSANSAVEQESTSYGWFNSGTWHATDKLNLTVGARLAYDEKEIESTRFAASDFVPAPGTTSTTVNADDSWSEIDWRATVDFHFTDNHMSYITASKAYRAGQYTINILPNIPGPLQSDDFIEPVPPEKVINYELGARTSWFEDRLRINPTGYFMFWSSRQAARQIVDPSTATGFRIGIVDSGDVDVYGVEVDAQFLATEWLSFDGAFGITKYRVKDPIANSGPNLFPAQASPSGNFGVTGRAPLGGAGTLVMNASWAYIGEQETHPTINTDSSYMLPSYSLVNARIQWTSPDARNTVSLFANNLLDKTYSTYATRFGGGFWDAGSGVGLAAPLRSAIGSVRGRPREFGITVQHNF